MNPIPNSAYGVLGSEIGQTVTICTARNPTVSDLSEVFALNCLLRSTGSTRSAGAGRLEWFGICMPGFPFSDANLHRLPCSDCVEVYDIV